MTTVHTATLYGIDAQLHRVVTSPAPGCPRPFSVCGLSEPAQREAKIRVLGALRAASCVLPADLCLDVSPAPVQSTACLDLAFAVALAAPDLPAGADLGRTVFAGELALDGTLKPIRGTLAIAEAALAAGFTTLCLPAANAREADRVRGLRVEACHTFGDVLQSLAEPERRPSRPQPASAPPVDLLDYADVLGQAAAKRALLIAAAGGHSALLLGSPGAGKTMLARRLPTILPPLTDAEGAEVDRIYGAVGLLPPTGHVAGRPFRAPHHTISDAGLVGGGASPRPGEASLAHRGVLFVDEVTELRRNVLDHLFRVLRTREVEIARAERRLRLPADFLFVASAAPCPCGFHGHPARACTCTPEALARFRAHLAQVVTPEIDVVIPVSPVRYADVGAATSDSASLRACLLCARAAQRDRFAHSPGTLNARMTPAQTRRFCPLDADAKALLGNARQDAPVGPAAYLRLLRVARTIADLAGSALILPVHAAEALALWPPGALAAPCR